MGERQGGGYTKTGVAYGGRTRVGKLVVDGVAAEHAEGEHREEVLQVHHLPHVRLHLLYVVVVVVEVVVVVSDDRRPSPEMGPSPTNPTPHTRIQQHRLFNSLPTHRLDGRERLLAEHGEVRLDLLLREVLGEERAVRLVLVPHGGHQPVPEDEGELVAMAMVMVMGFVG